MFAQNLRFAVYSISTLLTLMCLVWRASYAPAQEVPAQQMRSQAEELTLYVSTAGNDSWSGRLGEPNADATDGPLELFPKTPGPIL